MTTTVSLLCCLLGLLIAASAASLSDNTVDEATKGNELMDKIIKELHEECAEEYDPYCIETQNFKLEKKIVFFNFIAELTLNGCMEGLETLQVSGTSSLKRKGDILYLSSVLSVQNLKFSYSGNLKFQKWMHEITVDCEIDKVEVSVELNFDANYGSDGKVSDFQVNEVSLPKCKFSGFGSTINNFLESAAGKMRIISELTAKTALTAKVLPCLADLLAEWDFPVDDFTSGEK